MDTTYKQERGPVAISFDEYASRVLKEFHTLLDSDPQENAVQDFLEKHPSMVPGAWTPGSKSSHQPIHNALIMQPKLPGFEARIPDFLWLSNHSSSIFAALVEIEKPLKCLFTQQAVPSANFTQAYTQLANWRVWFDSTANKQLFFDHYGITSSQLRCLDFDLHLILVFGRRSEFEGVPKLSKLRAKLVNGKNEDLLSYDRLRPDPSLESAMTVKATGNGRFQVVHVPETFVTSPWLAHDLLPMDGLLEAIAANGAINAERRDFLKKRVKYWVNWARTVRTSYCIHDDAYKE